MIDVLLELFCSIVVGVILVLILSNGTLRRTCNKKGCNYIIWGFMLIFFGTLIDITDNFPELNRFYVIGDTPVEAFLEKVVGFLLGFILVFLGFREWLPELVRNQTKATESLEHASIKIHQLQDLLPICSSCKNIRNDDGYWQQVEDYVSSRSDIKFSHGICPSCAKKLFSERI